MDVTAIILAGGQSRRFGRDKTKLLLGKQNLVEATVEKCRSLFAEILIVSNAANKFALPGVREISDEFWQMGPMAGIHAGLKQARCPYGFVLACDMPLAEPKLMELIARRRWQYDVVLPCRNQYMEPLFGIYKKSLYLPIEKMLQQGERCILDLYPQVRVNYIPAAEWLPVVGHQQVFFNINEPEDYLNFLNGRQGGKKQEQRKSYYLAFCNQQKEAEEDVAEKRCAENKG